MQTGDLTPDFLPRGPDLPVVSLPQSPVLDLVARSASVPASGPVYSEGMGVGGEPVLLC